MAKREFTTRTVLIVLIGVVALASVAIKGELDKRKLSQDYAKAQTTVRQLEDDWVRLNQELSEARQTVETQTADLSQLHTQFGEIQARLTQTEEEVSHLHAEYAKLQDTNTDLSDRLALATKERETLQAKLSSVHELRLALRDLRHTIWKQHWRAWLDHIQTQRQEAVTQLAKGNRGYVVHNGTSTFSAAASTRLQVRVLDPETQ